MFLPKANSVFLEDNSHDAERRGVAPPRGVPKVTGPATTDAAPIGTPAPTTAAPYPTPAPVPGGVQTTYAETGGPSNGGDPQVLDPVTVEGSSSSSVPWVAIGIALLLAVAAFLYLRSRRK